MSTEQAPKNPIEELLKRLIADPKLLKDIEKMSQESVKLGLKEKEKKRISDRFGNLDYVNELKTTCRLCGTITTRYSPMIWDKLDKLHRASCISEIIRPEWISLSIRKIHQTRPSCNYCADTLKEWSKEDLIKRLIFIAEKPTSNSF